MSRAIGDDRTMRLSYATSIDIIKKDMIASRIFAGRERRSHWPHISEAKDSRIREPRHLNCEVLRSSGCRNFVSHAVTRAHSHASAIVWHPSTKSFREEWLLSNKGSYIRALMSSGLVNEAYVKITMSIRRRLRDVRDPMCIVLRSGT